MARFTLRSVLIIVTACAVMFFFAGIAYRGETWAWGATIGIFSLGVTAIVHVLFFGIVWCFAQLLSIGPRPIDSEPLMPREAGAKS